MGRGAGRLLAIVLAAGTACARHAEAPAPAIGAYGLGSVASSDDRESARRSVAYDGSGAPPGAGTAEDGASIFAARCTTCHLHGAGLAGVRGDWPYATSLFAYIVRAMPPDRTRPLTPDETYAVTAYVLWASGIVERHDRIDAASLSHVVMPAKAAFVDPNGSPLP